MTRQYNGKTGPLASHIISHLDGHGSVVFNDTISTLNEQGFVGLTAEVNPNEAQNEQLLFNNVITGHYTVGRDTLLPSGEILFADPPSYFDDHRLPSEGYASKLTRITIDLISANPLRDTSRKSIVANLQYFGTHSQFYSDISADNPSSGFITQFETLPTGPIQARLRISPPSNVPFAPGLWLLDAFLTDASGNRDTIEQYFTVSAVNGIEHVMNYPNPFKDKTDIAFVLKSESQPGDIKIVIYTVAGRKIRTITPTELRTGFNHTEWDGRDDKGNDVGNGTYLYRVIITGKNPDGTDISDGITEKAVRSR